MFNVGITIAIQYHKLRQFKSLYGVKEPEKSYGRSFLTLGLNVNRLT